MICARCAKDLEDGSSFCRYCGASVKPSGPDRRFARVPDAGKIAGICAGIAEYFDTDVTLVRLAWIALSIVPGVLVGGLIAYAVGWILIPVAQTPAVYTGKRLTRSASDRQVAGVCGGLAEYLGADPMIIRVISLILAIYPGVVIGGIVVYLIAWFIIPIAQPTTLVTPASSPA